jgi:hypothetical protein
MTAIESPKTACKEGTMAHRNRNGWLLVGGLIIAQLAVVSPLAAQTAPNKRAVRPPVLDLVAEAKRPRPGQVMPGRTAPIPAAPLPGAEPPAPPPATPAPTPVTVQPARVEAQPPTEPGTPTTPPGAPAPAAPSPGAPPAAKPPPSTQPPAPDRPVLEQMQQPAPPKDERDESRWADDNRWTGGVRFVAVDKVQATVTALEGPASAVQWRAVAAMDGRPGKWTNFKQGDSIDDRIDIRSGAGVTLTLAVADACIVRISPLTRVRLERKIRSDGSAELGVVLYRGEVEVDPRVVDELGFARSPIMVRTPEGAYPIRSRSAIGFNAFSGTTMQDVARQ